MLPKPEPIPEGDIAALCEAGATKFATYGPEISASLDDLQLDLLRERDETWSVGRKQEVQFGQPILRAIWRGLTKAQARRVAAALLQAGCGSATWLPAGAEPPQIPEATQLSIMRHLGRDLPIVRIGVIDLRSATITRLLAWQDRALAIHPTLNALDPWTVTAPVAGLAVVNTTSLRQARAGSQALQEACSDWSWATAAQLAPDLRARLERVVRQYQPAKRR